MSKSRILLLLNSGENKRLLIEQLSSHYEIVLLDEQPLPDSTIATPAFDLIICDLVELGRRHMQIAQWRQEAEPLFLPVLVFMSKKTVGTLPVDVRYQIDELVTVPLDPDELFIRIRLLLRSRHLSAELAQRNQTLEELNTLKTRFVSMVSHEFRSPLSIISGITQLLQKSESQYSHEKKQEMFQRMLNVITKLTNLLDDLLTLSRNTSSQVPFNPQPVNIQQHCENLVENFQLSTTKDRDIYLQSQGDLSSVSLDIALVDTILSNLISNAIKYSPELTPVNLRIERQNNQVVFQVSDQGQGIPLADQPALFDAFFRARNVGTIPGTGLGLSILKQCVDLHNGIVKVDSIPERGTTFTVTLSCE
jgi:signal transduction histidine kinase